MGEASRAHYQRHQQKYIALTAAAKLRITEFVRLSKDRPCADCGQSYPHYVMDFDHARGVKSFTISMDALRHGMAAVKEEIKKCDVVCSNCHRERSHVRLNQGSKP